MTSSTFRRAILRYTKTLTRRTQPIKRAKRPFSKSSTGGAMKAAPMQNLAQGIPARFR